MAGENEKQIHLNLLTDISDLMDPNSPEYDNFIEHMKQYVPKGVLARNPTLLKKLQALATKGGLGIGNYDAIKNIAKRSGNDEVYELIVKTEEKIKAVVNQKQEAACVKDVSQDARGSKRKIEDDDNSDVLYSRCSQGLGRYDTQDKKGYLLLLNSTENRNGTEEDVKKLKKFFGDDGLKFEIDDPRTYENDDLTTAKLSDCFKAVRNMLNGALSNKYYCFICVILSHGNEDGIRTKDGMISTDKIRQGFNNTNMPKFAGRPKLFFIQACRGKDVQDFAQVDDEADDHNTADTKIEDESDVTINIPTDADTLLAFSTTPGYRSFRRTVGPVQGSWFIIECMRVFDKYWTTQHVEDMLITVRERVALEWSKVDGGKQMPCVWSTLTKRLFLSRRVL